jgi:ATP-dependent protease ClpP protease subunit
MTTFQGLTLFLIGAGLCIALTHVARARQEAVPTLGAVGLSIFLLIGANVLAPEAQMQPEVQVRYLMLLAGALYTKKAYDRMKGWRQSRLTVATAQPVLVPHEAAGHGHRPAIQLRAATCLSSGPAPYSYAELMELPTIQLRGVVDLKMEEWFCKQLRLALGLGRELTVTLNTPGGDAAAAFAIMEHLRAASQTHVIHLILIGSCYSAGTIIMSGVPIGQRYATSGSELMLHCARNGTPEENGRVSRRIATIISGSSTVEEDSLLALFESGQDLYLKPYEAVRLGLVAHVL